jgi:hypothetical protein
MPDCEVSITGRLKEGGRIASREHYPALANSRIGSSGCGELKPAYHEAYEK